MRHPGSVSPRPARRRIPSIFQPLHWFSVKLLHLTAIFSLVAIAESPATNPPVKPAASSAAGNSSSQLDVLVDPPGLLYQGVPPEIPQDEGAAGLQLELLRLGTTARLMQVVAHPDDEDGGMLTLEARGRGVSTLLMTLNRGEGGQNKIGSNLSDVLGVLRAEELLASDQYYGVQERFSRVADFGFSKSAEETFTKWGGHDVALGDIVRVIRTFRPDVLVARFSGTERDGHGHHQASSILAKEAFRAAADPKRFPEQIAEGLSPGRRKSCTSEMCAPFGAQTCPDADWTLKLNTGEKSGTWACPMCSSRCRDCGTKCRKEQRIGLSTKGIGLRFTGWRIRYCVPLSRRTGHEQSFFNGIDTTLAGTCGAIGGRGEEASATARRTHVRLRRQVAEATEDAKGNDVSRAATPLMKIVRDLRRVSGEVRLSSVSAEAKFDLLTRIAEKQGQAETALNLALGVSLTADVVSEANRRSRFKGSRSADHRFAGTRVSGRGDVAQRIEADARDHHIKLEVPAGWTTIEGKTKPETVKAGEDLHANFRLRVPKNAAYTRPYWHRENPERRR